MPTSANKFGFVFWCFLNCQSPRNFTRWKQTAIQMIFSSAAHVLFILQKSAKHDADHACLMHKHWKHELHGCVCICMLCMRLGYSSVSEKTSYILRGGVCAPWAAPLSPLQGLLPHLLIPGNFHHPYHHHCPAPVLQQQLSSSQRCWLVAKCSALLLLCSDRGSLPLGKPWLVCWRLI